VSIHEVAALSLGTSFGEFKLHAFEVPSGRVYLALVRGDLRDGRSVLTRLHSECLTGDALGSLRCDCGIQLREAARAIAAEGRGVLVYATGQEGRGIGLVNKLRAYMLQENGDDTIDANVRLGFPPDARDYDAAAGCLAHLGIRSVRLLTNNPSKVEALTRAGIDVDEAVPLQTSPHLRNLDYLRAKEARLGHVAPAGAPLPGNGIGEATNVAPLLGRSAAPDWRPYVVLKYAQTLDGRIATRQGDAKWISSEPERRISHALRAACDAVLVGVGTATVDDPQLTVRMVSGPSPLRVVHDSALRLP
jgi:GTP cyclohydrolase II